MDQPNVTSFFFLLTSAYALESQLDHFEMPRVSCYSCRSDSRTELFPLCDGMHWYTLTERERQTYMTICLTGCVKIVQRFGEQHRRTIRGCGRNCNISLSHCNGYEIGCGWYDFTKSRKYAEEMEAKEDQVLKDHMEDYEYGGRGQNAVVNTTETPEGETEVTDIYACVCDTDLCNGAMLITWDKSIFFIILMQCFFLCGRFLIQ